MGSYIETECQNCDGSGSIPMTNVSEAKTDDDLQLLKKTCYVCGGEGCFVAKRPDVHSTANASKAGKGGHVDKSEMGFSDYKRRHR